MLWSFVFGFFFLLNASQFDWNGATLKVPSSWEGRRYPMASLGGFILDAKIKKERVKLFVHTQKPENFSTRSGTRRFWKKYISDMKTEVQSKCEERTIGVQHCRAIGRDNQGKWLVSSMIWKTNQKRAFLKVENVDSKKRAKEISQLAKLGLQ